MLETATPATPTTDRHKLYFGTDGSLKSVDDAAAVTTYASSAGDVSSNTSTSVDSEIALFSSTTGKLIKRATGTGVVHATSGVYSASAVSLTADVSGILPVANGGTNSSTSLNNNRVMKSAGGSVVEAAAITAARALKSDANGIPVHSTATGADLDSLSGTNTGDQTISLTGDVTGSGTGSFAATIAADAVTNAKLANVATATFKGRTTGGTGDPEDLTVSQAKTLLSLTGTNSGDQTITLTGDVTGSGTGSFAATIATGAVTDTKGSLANKPACTVVATSNQALTGTPTIDSQATAAGSIILATAQTSGSENGPWVAAAGAWARPTWYPAGGTTQSFQFITTFIRLGTTYQGSTWRMTTSGAITIDTTATTWVVTPHAINTSTVTNAASLSMLTVTNFLQPVVALSDGATISLDASLGNIFSVTLGGNRTLAAPTNPTDGQRIVLKIIQDGTGSRTLTLNAIYRFGTDITSLTLTTTASKTDYIGIMYNSASTKWDVLAISKGY